MFRIFPKNIYYRKYILYIIFIYSKVKNNNVPPGSPARPPGKPGGKLGRPDAAAAAAGSKPPLHENCI